MPPSPPSPPPNATVAAACTELVPPTIPSKLVTSRCTLLPDAYGTCTLKSVSFQQLLALSMNATSSSTGCAGCACTADLNPTCETTCSALGLYNTQISAMNQGVWWDRNTRAIIIDIPIFFPNVNLFQSYRILFEFPAVGAMQGSVNVRTFKLYRYASAADILVLGFEIIFLFLVLYNTITNVLEFFKVGWRVYLTDTWKYIEWANLILFYVLAAYRITATQALAAATLNQSSFASYVDLTPLAAYSYQETNVFAVNFVLVYLRLLKYFFYVPRLNMIMLTIMIAIFDLVVFSCVVALVLFAFASAFYICFGKDVALYSTVGNAMGTLSRGLLGGDTGFDALGTSNGVMGPFLFFMFEAVVFFVLLNMFLAILNESIKIAKEMESDDDLNFYLALRDEIASNLGKVRAHRRVPGGLLYSTPSRPCHVFCLLQAEWAPAPMRFENPTPRETQPPSKPLSRFPLFLFPGISCLPAARRLRSSPPSCSRGGRTRTTWASSCLSSRRSWRRIRRRSRSSSPWELRRVESRAAFNGGTCRGSWAVRRGLGSPPASSPPPPAPF